MCFCEFIGPDRSPGIGEGFYVCLLGRLDLQDPVCV